MVAHLTAKAGEKDAAEKDLAALLTDVPADDSLRFLVVERLAFLQEARGDQAAALRTLETLKGDAFYADRAALAAARIEIAMGDTAKARTRLEKLEADHANEPVGTEADDMLTAMGVVPTAAADKDGPSPASADLANGAPTTKAD
jgi:predicted negative regulator of RcsB-dependent stress response